ncbi:MAG: tetratricopeptide repeat protein [Acidobacteria bacterium]|nr:tetratricopeptide repeat protein [Acidobacteriota bacterium]
MEGLLSMLGRPEGYEPTPLDRAQELMYRAWEAPTPERAEALARQALSISADCADAYNLLAEVTADSLEEALEFYRQGVAAGERALGAQTFQEHAGYFWGLVETRPYMRALDGLADCLWAVGQHEQAVAHYREMLRLNPNDNQGIRDVLLPYLIELNRDAEANELHRRYDEHMLASWLYNRVLLDYRMHGPSAVAEQSLQAALNCNPYVPLYLLGQEDLPEIQPEFFGLGDESEAILYTMQCLGAWLATPGSLVWLASRME